MVFMASSSFLSKEVYDMADDDGGGECLEGKGEEDESKGISVFGQILRQNNCRLRAPMAIGISVSPLPGQPTRYFLLQHY